MGRPSVLAVLMMIFMLPLSFSAAEADSFHLRCGPLWLGIEAHGDCYPCWTYRGWLGVHIQDLNDQLREYFKVPSGGALVTEVEEDSPAEEAGLRAGDVIVEVNGERIDDAEDLIDEISRMEKGETAKIKVIRDGKEKVLEAKIEERKGWPLPRHFRRYFEEKPRFWMPYPPERFYFWGPYPEGNTSELERLIDRLNGEIREMEERVEDLERSNDKLREEIERLKDEVEKLRKGK